MKRIVEAAGEIWHEKLNASLHCDTCRVGCVTYHPAEMSDFLSKHSNPSKDDLNEMFRLADKLDVKYIKLTIDLDGQHNAEIPSPAAGVIQSSSSTYAGALYSALIKVVESRARFSQTRNMSDKGGQ